MMKANYKFFKNGVDNQKRADVAIDFRRPDVKEFSSWTSEQRQELFEFLKPVEAALGEYLRVLKTV